MHMRHKTETLQMREQADHGLLEPPRHHHAHPAAVCMPRAVLRPVAAQSWIVVRRLEVTTRGPAALCHHARHVHARA